MSVGDLPADFIQTQRGNVEIAPERFSSAGEIRDTCNAMLAADRIRAPWRASIDGLFDGNPTYKLSTLKSKGQGWRARVNFREGEGLINSRQTPFYDLVTEVDPCIEVELNYGAGPTNADISNKIAKHFHWMFLTAWRSGFNFHIPLQQLEMLKHGIGCHVWPSNPFKWIPRTPASGHVLFPDGITLNLREDLDYFMLRDFLPGYAVHNFIRNENAAKKEGWNVPMVWDALLQTSKQRYRSGEYRYGMEQLQREIKSGDIGTTQSRQSGLWLNHLFVKEIGTDKISQYTVAEGVSTLRGGGKKMDPFEDCLYRKRNRFDDWPLVIFPYCMGNGGLLHTVRGLGARTKDFFELSNRVYNAMADQVLVGSTLNVKQTGDVDPDKLRLMRLGMMSIIPKGLELIPGVQFPNLAQGPLALQDRLHQTLNSNNENYLQSTPEAKDRETYGSYQMRMQNSGQVSKGTHAQYASNYQMLLEKIFFIVIKPEAALGSSLSAKLAKAFQDRCAADGITSDILARVTEVQEVFSTGAGSAAARLDSLMTIFKLIYPTTTEERKINIERDLVAAVSSATKVDRYARSHSDGEMPTSDDSLAIQENNGLAAGGDAEVAPMQDHVGHATRHLHKGEEVAQGVMQGQMDPEQAYIAISKLGEHTAGHLKILQGNPMRKAEFDSLYQEWQALSIIADKLKQQLEARAAAQPQQSPQQQASDQLQIGMAKVAVNDRLGQEKLASKTRLDLSRLAIDGRIKAMKTQLEARNGSRAQ